MDRTVNKAAADAQGQSWPRKGQERGHSPASPAGQTFMGRRAEAAPAPSPPTSAQHQRPTSGGVTEETRKFKWRPVWEMWSNVSIQVLCGRCSEVYVIHICLLLWALLARVLLSRLLHKLVGKYKEFMIQCTLRTCQHTPGHKHISIWQKQSRYIPDNQQILLFHSGVGWAQKLNTGRKTDIFPCVGGKKKTPKNNKNKKTKNKQQNVTTRRKTF